MSKQIFEDAVERELLARNPFAGLHGAVGGNRERDFFVDRDTTAKVLDACPDSQWRLLFALARYGLLRCPSEILALTWSDVNWGEGRMIVRSSKTEHHEGKAFRVVPLFSELRPFLNAVWDEAEEKAQFVITRYRAANANLRMQLTKVIAQAGRRRMAEAVPKSSR
jgi:integrase